MKTQLFNGSVIGFVAWDWYSAAINLGTLGIPGVSLHHVGIVCDGLIYESAESDRPPCAVQGKKVKGVQAHTLQELSELPFYSKIWEYPLHRKLYRAEKDRLEKFLASKLGVEYDMKGAVNSGGKIHSWVHSLFHPEDTSTLFCSELVAAALTDIGLMKTSDVSKWNPNRLCRHLLRSGTCVRPFQLK